VIVSGGAVGVDRTAEVTARKLSMQVCIHEAHWAHYGRSAGMVRNRLIVQGCDVLVAFYDGTSKGTANTIGVARSMHKPLYIIQELGTQTSPEGD
jgi:predicted Rossmann fold nucleotide-binding protein DprA/Smf involved in DNA uptake